MARSFLDSRGRVKSLSHDDVMIIRRIASFCCLDFECIQWFIHGGELNGVNVKLLRARITMVQ